MAMARVGGAAQHTPDPAEPDAEGVGALEE